MKLGLIACVVICTQLIDAYKQNCGSVKNNTLTSPGYPNNYQNGLDCIYRVPIPLDKDLVIHFNNFSLESHSNCKWDYLRINDSSNRIIGTYCGYQTGKRISVVGSIAVLTFHTDASGRYRGFLSIVLLLSALTGLWL
ncbi:PREDICTED: CUB and peptidase domain-containing protein 2-like isoform X3 [Acropora digitifera]|uniref:CUB and peptidase domain-containing protein 2-like isoform X2 n=1 Tax=Acropora digitifera TaxID=70779 RepID=UPI00077A0D0D|nr:PREDICTED: CUB and peptidase domain-containing protein 2-like isoform X2 [Acropora digitifera]XP_015762667.1 PREDICTED: CUB and peptidase domain-containing protein 2-like isoform X3 [Acropora digitifera]